MSAALSPSLSREASRTDACPCGRGHGATGRWYAVVVGRPLATVGAGRTRPTKLTGWRTTRPPGLATLAERPRVGFFPEWVTSHTKKSPNQKIGNPSVGTQNGPLKPPPTCLRLDVPNLQILQIGDISDMLTNSIMSLHNVDSILIHRISWDQQNWTRGANLLISATPLKFDCLIS